MCVCVCACVCVCVYIYIYIYAVAVYAIHVDQTCNSLKMAREMFRRGFRKFHVLFDNMVRGERFENINVVF